MGSEDVVRVVDEVLNTDDFCLCNDLEFAKRVFSCLTPVGIVVNGFELWVLQNFKPLVSLLGIDSEQDVA